jgi:hypothetical protein
MSSLWKYLEIGTSERKNVIVTFVTCVHATQKIFYFLLLEITGVIDAKGYHWKVGDKDSISKFQEDLEQQIRDYLKHADPH